MEKCYTQNQGWWHRSGRRSTLCWAAQLRPAGWESWPIEDREQESESKSGSRRRGADGKARRWELASSLLEVRWQEGWRAWKMLGKLRQEAGQAHRFRSSLQPQVHRNQNANSTAAAEGSWLLLGPALCPHPLPPKFICWSPNPNVTL